VSVGFRERERERVIKMLEMELVKFESCSLVWFGLDGWRVMPDEGVVVGVQYKGTFHRGVVVGLNPNVKEEAFVNFIDVGDNDVSVKLNEFKQVNEEMCEVRVG
jgi:hypothetical protein